MTTKSSIKQNMAFNQGCDARLAGQPRTANPYSGIGEKGLRMYWNMGWTSANTEWGMDAKWPIEELPPVMPTKG